MWVIVSIWSLVLLYTVCVVLVFASNLSLDPIFYVAVANGGVCMLPLKLFFVMLSMEPVVTQGKYHTAHETLSRFRN